jgi:hypothetical protein
MHMYPCPTKSSESNNRKKVFTSRKYYDEIMTACHGLATLVLNECSSDEDLDYLLKSLLEVKHNSKKNGPPKAHNN